MRKEHQVLFWLAALALVVLIIAVLRDILLPFVAAIVIAYFLNPLPTAWRRADCRASGAAIIIVGLVAVLIGLALVLLVPLLADRCVS